MRKQRQLNIELLRIVAMMLITVGHFYPWFLMPYEGSYNSHMISCMNKVIALLSFHVDCFFLISGYFSIRHRIPGIAKIWFLCLFYHVADAGLLALRGGQIDFLKILFPITHGGWWFINIYACLLLLAPILNKAVENADKKEWRVILWSLIIVDVYCGFFQRMDTVYHYGYDIINAMTVYAIGRYLAIQKIAIPTRKAILLFLSAIAINAAFTVLGHKMGVDLRLGNGNYCNPLVIAASVGFFFIFLNLKVNWKCITFFATSAVSIYVCTALPSVKQLVADAFHCVYMHFDALCGRIPCHDILVGVGLFLFFMVALFVIITAIDKVRIYLYGLVEYKILCRTVFKILNDKTNGK